VVGWRIGTLPVSEGERAATITPMVLVWFDGAGIKGGRALDANR